MTVPATMRALLQTSLKGPGDVRLIDDAPVPDPGPGEVLVRVVAAGVNFADLSRAYGTFLGGPQAPYVAGFEAAGEIVAMDGEVDGEQLGALVVGVGDGAFAEYVVLPAVAAVPVPPGWTAEQALGLVVNWPTALAALKPLGRIAPGETVLIHAAAGATGQPAVTMELDLDTEPANLLEPTDPRARALLDGYIAAFERSDAGLLEQVLRADATLEATPFGDWQAGRANCIRMLDAQVLGQPGDWRMTPTTANGQPAAAVYHRRARGDPAHHAYGIVVLSPTASGVRRVTAFHHDPSLPLIFGLPDVLSS